MTDEEKAARRSEAAKKAAVTRRKKFNAEVWAKVEPRLIKRDCKCGLKPGMTWDDLRPLGAGCTDPLDYHFKILGNERKVYKQAKRRQKQAMYWHAQPVGYVCPVLDYYRRLQE